jgi:hypothetical protein
MDEETEDAAFKALSFGLTPHQYVDAVKLVYVKSDITRQTRALALCMKYPREEWVLLLNAASRMMADRDRLRE